MKRKVLLAGAIAWSLLALVILGVLIMTLTGNWKIPFLSGRSFSAEFASSTQLVKEESFPVSGLDAIDISTSYHKIFIRLVEGNQITLRQYDADAENLFTAQKSGGTFEIKIEPRNVIGIMAINFSPRLEIDLPKSYAAAMSLSTSSGTIECAADTGAVSWGNTKITTSSGTVRLDGGIICAALDVTTGSGSVNLGNLMAERVSVTTSSGTVRLKELTVQGAVTLKTGSGSINTDDVTASDFSSDSNSGTQRFEDISVSGAVNLSSGSGSINSEGISAASLAVDSNSGTLRLGDLTVSGKASISSGSGSHNTGELSCESYDITTNSGTLNYKGISGMGNVKSGSGSINCESLDVKGDSTVTTSSGTIRLTLEENQNFELDISTNSGNIRANDFNLLYRDQRGNTAFGKVGNGGNVNLTISSGSGSININ